MEQILVSFFLFLKEKESILWIIFLSLAFHQAIGDAIGLSVATPKHFQTLGLLQRSVDESSYDINYLFTMAIDKVAFLPFALSLDNWRYDVFSGAANKHRMNCHYWNLR